MSDSMQWKLIGCFVLVMFSSLSADALEIRVKRECRCTGSLVRLGDVADVLDDDAERASAVAQIALFPAPSQSRFVTSQELQRLVQLNGISLAECRFTGSKSARVTVAATTTARPSGRQTPIVGTVRRSQKRLESAIVNYLKQIADPAAEWEVRVTATRRQLQLVSNEQDDLAISGGREPWLGRQRFVVTVNTLQGPTRFEARADVTQPSMIVVARRPLRRGETIRSADIELRPDPKDLSQDVFFQIQQVIGLETIRTIRAGEPIVGRAVQPPILVRRGEIISVVALASGVRVRTTAIATEDGRQGELILIQTTDKKHKYTARVTDLQTVEIYASGHRVTR